MSYALAKLKHPFEMFSSTAKANDVFPLLVYCDFPGQLMKQLRKKEWRKEKKSERKRIRNYK